MANEEFARQKQQFLQQKEQFYRENPMVGKWVKTKRLLWRIMAVYLIVHSALSVIVMIQTQDYGAITFEVLRCMFGLLWSGAFISPEGGWRFSIMLYLSAAYNVGMLVKNASLMAESLPYLAWMPALGVLYVMEVLAPFLLLALAIYLTAFPKHRALSEQVEAFNKNLNAEFQNSLKK